LLCTRSCEWHIDAGEAACFDFSIPAEAVLEVKNMLTTDQSARSRLLVQLMAGAQAGDKEAFRALVNEIGPALTNFVRRRTLDPAELEDVCQEILLEIYESRHTYDAKRPLEPWLFAIARYVVINHGRRQRWRAAHQQLTDAVADTAGENPGNILTRLRQALNQLPPFQREALVMTKIEGLSIAESSRRAGTSTTNMKVRVHRAAAFLKKAILD
jgi:RNA polymerase sigma-70 factor, ECF subfamily